MCFLIECYLDLKRRALMQEFNEPHKVLFL